MWQLKKVIYDVVKYLVVEKKKLTFIYISKLIMEYILNLSIHTYLELDCSPDFRFSHH